MLKTSRLIMGIRNNSTDTVIDLKFQLEHIQTTDTKHKGDKKKHLAPTRLASPSMLSVPITFVLIVCKKNHLS